MTGLIRFKKPSKPRLTILAGAFCLSVIVSLLTTPREVERSGSLLDPTEPAVIGVEDMATIVVAARIIRHYQNGHPEDVVPDDTIAHILTDLNYNNCREFTYWDDVETCRDSIPLEEIRLVRKALVAPWMFSMEVAQ